MKKGMRGINGLLPWAAVLCLFAVLVALFPRCAVRLTLDTAALAARGYLVFLCDTEKAYQSTAEAVSAVVTTEPEIVLSEMQTTAVTVSEAAQQQAQTVMSHTVSLSRTDEDIALLMKQAQEESADDKQAGKVSEYQYINDGVTDSYGLVRVKNVNETPIDISEKLNEGLKLSIERDKPSVLIYHTHTTETYQLLDRDFYTEDFASRSSNPSVNMVRVGQAICEQLEAAGFQVIHDTCIYDKPYSGAYTRSRSGAQKWLEKYPSIEITLDIHRDAIHRDDGTKIKPVALIEGSKAAQIMIISGCQESGNGITDLPGWEDNLSFAVQLQNKLEQLFKGITRPLYFCPRSYNMNLTPCSLLVEVGSDGNTLEQAVYTGKCLGRALAEIMEEYVEND